MYTRLRQVFVQLWTCNIVIRVHVNSSKFREKFRCNNPLVFAMKYKTETESPQPLRLYFSFSRTYISRATLFSGDRIPVRARFSATVQTGPVTQPASCTMGTGSFPRVKSGRGVTLTPHPLLVPWSRKGRAVPLLPLWAVRPVQSLSACMRVHFTLHYFRRFIHTHNFRTLY
jgi:hypothetical protein